MKSLPIYAGIRRSIRACILLTMAACSGSDLTNPEPAGGSGTPAQPPTIASVSLPFTSITLSSAALIKPKVTARDSSGTEVTTAAATLTSSDNAVIGIVGTTSFVAKLGGQAILTAAVGGKSASATVNVVKFASITAGAHESCAISTSGVLYCSGTPFGLFATVVSSEQRWTQLAGSAAPVGSPTSTICGITNARTVMCWGSNSNGQLGVGDRRDNDLARLVTLPAAAASVSVGNLHVCAVLTTGDVYCWGSNEFGQLGDGKFVDREVPVRVNTGLGFSRVVAGGRHTCALSSDGRIFCWGGNELGQLGRGSWSAEGSTVVAEIAGGLKFKSLSARAQTTCALSDSGEAYCWGANTVFELGRVTSELCRTDGHPCSSIPTAVSGGLRFEAVSVAGFGGCGLNGQTAYCWGMNIQSSLGASSVPPCPISGAAGCTSIPLAGPTSLVSVSGGTRHYCGLGLDGGAYCWGGNTEGELGFPGVSESSTPKLFTIDPALQPPR